LKALLRWVPLRKESTRAANFCGTSMGFRIHPPAVFKPR
jgi:hypothetical protein